MQSVRLSQRNRMDQPSSYALATGSFPTVPSVSDAEIAALTAEICHIFLRPKPQPEKPKNENANMVP